MYCRMLVLTTFSFRDVFARNSSVEIGVWIERIKNSCICKSTYSIFNWFARFMFGLTVEALADALCLSPIPTLVLATGSERDSPSTVSLVVSTYSGMKSGSSSSSSNSGRFSSSTPKTASSTSVNLLVAVPANTHLIVWMESKCMVIAVFSM